MIIKYLIFNELEWHTCLVANDKLLDLQYLLQFGFTFQGNWIKAMDQPDPKWLRSFYNSPIMHVCIKRLPSYLPELIQRIPNYNFNQLDVNGNTLVHVAISKPNELLQIIHRVDSRLLTKLNHHQQTPLHLAVSEPGKLEHLIMESIQIYLKYNPHPDLNTPDQSGDTVLHLAIKHGYMNVINILLNYPLNPTILNGNGVSYLQQLITHPFPFQLFSKFIKHFPDLPLDVNAISIAANDASYHKIYYYLQHIQITQRYPSLNAFQIVQIWMQQRFIEQSLDIFAHDTENNNVMHLCAQLGNLECIQYFIQFHPQLQIQNNQRNTALMMSCDHADVLVVLLNYIVGCIQYHDHVEMALAAINAKNKSKEKIFAIKQCQHPGSKQALDIAKGLLRMRY
eukprot:NODE_61_length_26588_cov_1.146778.p5 type:complete len:396 gc:universal NODE_61_length_26588_cov_1.146778:4088-2901(-)